MTYSATDKRKNARGFSLLELVVVMAIMLVLAVLSVPWVLKINSDLSLRYMATNLNGLLQSARMTAIRKNDYYTVQSTSLPTGGSGYYVHLHGASYTSGDPVLPIGSQMTIHLGAGSGAPNESTFLSNLNFTVNSGSEFPSFNARGLPCFASANTCPQTGGQGFVFFLTNATISGDYSWGAVAITPSGRMQIWTCDGSGTWILRT
jgi:prepilin-type N-terminal cleavage/methylation domain-containing protein